jgi:hypothetical protein
MKKSTSCAECESIALEYREACVAFWLNASEETRDACRAILASSQTWLVLKYTAAHFGPKSLTV